MTFRTRTSVVFICPDCGTETDIGVSPNYGTIVKCSNAICHKQEAFTGSPHILTAPQQPETHPTGLRRFWEKIAESYVTVLVALILNFLTMAIITVLTYYIVRSTIEKELPLIIQREIRENPASK